MTPEPGQLVRCIFRNGITVAEGIVKSWSDGKSVLTSKDGNDVLVIMNTAQDISLVKITLAIPEQTKTILTKAFEEVKEEVGHDPERLRNLADLRIALAEQERKIVAEKLTEHRATGQTTTRVTYGYGLLPVQSAK